MEKLSPGERIERVVCWAGLSTRAFATHIGLPTVQTLYQIKAGEYDISRKVASLIVRSYPEINLAWLLSGEGEMLLLRRRPVPRYREDCREVALSIESLTPDGEVVVEGCGGCLFVAPYNSRSLEPEIGQGSLLFCEESSPEALCEGGTYLVTTAQRGVVGRLLSCTNGTLCFGGGSAQTSTTMEPSQIRSVYRVRASLEWKNI